MDSDTACKPDRVEPCSAHDAARVASDSPSDRKVLRHSSDFRRVLASGRRAHRGGVTVVACRGLDNTTRTGLVVGKSVGNSVARNRAKRRLRHALAKTPLEQAMDYVIIADRRVAGASFADLCDWLQSAVERVGS